MTFKNHPIEILNLSERPYRALLRAGISTIEDLKNINPVHLAQTKGVGDVGFLEIRNKLNQHNNI